MKKQWWTAILLYPDYKASDYGADIFVEWAFRFTWEQAAEIVQRKAHEANPDAEADDFRPIAVWKGRTTLAATAASF